MAHLTAGQVACRHGFAASRGYKRWSVPHIFTTFAPSHQPAAINFSVSKAFLGIHSPHKALANFSNGQSLLNYEANHAYFEWSGASEEWSTRHYWNDPDFWGDATSGEPKAIEEEDSPEENVRRMFLMPKPTMMKKMIVCFSPINQITLNLVNLLWSLKTLMC